MESECDFKRIYSAHFERCREKSTKSHAYRKRFRLGQHFDVGQEVLHENDRHKLSKSQKLQHRRLSFFTVTKRITNRTYQIQNDSDHTFTRTVHQNHLVEYYPKEETLHSIIEYYVPMDRSHDDFYERFMEQGIQKLNNPEQLRMEDSLPFPRQPLRAVPTALPKKGIRNTSSGYGVTSPHALSPPMPVTPDSFKFFETCLMSLTSRMTPPASSSSQPLTPIQQFIRKSRKKR